MWSSNSSKSLKRLNKIAGTSSPSSSSTSSSSQSSAASRQNPRGIYKTMEEVWKDINLSSLQDQPSSRDDPSSTTTFRGMIFQDFLARPFDKDPPTTTPATGYCSPPPPPPPPPPQATMLTLNSSGPDEFHLFGNSNPLRQTPLLGPQQSISHACSNLSMQFNDALGSCAAGMHAHGNGKKRCPEPQTNSSSSGDRRHKRMIKNRESAARSRARKQAYTNELELEVNNLMEENARLREQQRQLCLAAVNQQVPRKHALYRTLTAPF
nr:protein FD-like [Coffea arabica]